MCPRAVAKPRTQTRTQAEIAKLWILLVGVNQYQDEYLPSLKYSALDCQGLGEALREATATFPAKEVIVHHDFAAEQPTIATVRHSLKKIITQARSEDTILVYFSGHGVLEPQTQQVVLCFADTDKEQLLDTGLALQELLQWFSTCAASQQLVWLDACHSGGMTLRGTDRISLPNPTSQLVQVLRKKAAQSKGFYALLSCDQTQQSWEFPELGHGVFTYYLMRGLRGEAADCEGIIEADALYQYVYHQTLRYIDKTNQQIRLINQQKSSRGERRLQSEYPLQTPKRIVEGFGKVILGKRSPLTDDAIDINPRQALVIDALGNNQMTMALSKVLNRTGRFALKYFPQTDKNWSEVKEAIACCLAVDQPIDNSAAAETRTALLYLRGKIETTDTGESWLVLKEGVKLSRSWLRQVLRHSAIAQQIVILDCPEADSLTEWLEELQLESDRGQCLIAAAANPASPQQFTQALQETLQTADAQAGLPVAAWITQLQIYLAGTCITPHFWLSGSRGVIEVLPGRSQNRKAGDSGIFDLGICPYMGLQAFSEDNAEYFHGREVLSQKLLTQINHNSTLAVVGASGSGKSSVVQAGLISQLRQGKQLPGSQQWWLGCFRPGSGPLAALARKLVDPGTDQEKAQQQLQIEGLLYQGVEGFVQWLRSRSEPMVVLVVDQFEELFTLTEECDRQQFLSLLLGAVKYASDRFKLILTIRADFVAACLEIPELAPILQQSSVLVPPYLTEADYRNAIIKPAEQVGLKVESGLVEVLLKELEQSAGDLPLLQFVLQQLWERRQQGKLTLATYQQLGGMKGALEKQAQAVYEQLDPAAQECARWIFLNLTQLGEGTEDTRRRISKSDLIVAKYPAALVEQTLQTLTDAKLIVVNLDQETNSGQSRSGDTPPADDELLLETMQQEATVEVVHEILIRHWSTLRWWLEENRARLRAQRQIEQAANLWQQKRKQPDFLLRGVRLAEAEELYIKYTDELTETAREFIAACLAARELEQKEAKRRLRRAQATAAALGILGLAATVFGGLAYRQKLLAQIENVDALNASSEALLLSDQQLESLMTSIKAGKQLKQIGGWGQKLIGKDSWTKIKLKTAGTLQQAVAGTQELNRLVDHSQRVNAVSYSPDGQLIATASDDHTIKLWRKDGALLATLEGHQERVTNLAFSPNGDILASASADQTIRLWQIVNNQAKPLRKIKGHQDWITSIAFSPQGNLIASTSRDGTIKLWQLDGTLVANVGEFESWVNSVNFADEKIIAAGGEDGVLRLWSIEDNQIQQIGAIEGSDRLTQVKFSSDGKQIGAASGDGTVKVWQVEDGSLINTYNHGEQVNSFSFSPDGQILATGSADGKVNLWSSEGLLQQVFAGHGGEIHSLDFNPNGKELASASADKTVRLWQIKAPASLSEGGVYSVSVSPTSPELFAAAGWDGKIRLWRINSSQSKELLRTLSGHQMAISQIQFSPDGKLLASASGDGTVKLWRVADGVLLDTLEGHQSGVNAIAFNHEPRKANQYLLASGSEDKTIKLWQITAVGEKYKIFAAKTLKGHQDGVKTLVFSPTGDLLASGSYDRTIKLWNLNGELEQTLEGHTLAVATVQFSPDGQTLVSGSWDNTIKLWHVAQPEKPIQTLSGHQNGVTTLSFSPAGQIFASGSADGQIKLWDSRNRTELKTLRGHTSPINSLAFSSNGQTLIGAEEQRGISLWNLELDNLWQQGCDLLSSYLQNNANLTKSDRQICSK